MPCSRQRMDPATGRVHSYEAGSRLVGFEIESRFQRRRDSSEKETTMFRRSTATSTSQRNKHLMLIVCVASATFAAAQVSPSTHDESWNTTSQTIVSNENP